MTVTSYTGWRSSQVYRGLSGRDFSHYSSFFQNFRETLSEEVLSSWPPHMDTIIVLVCLGTKHLSDLDLAVRNIVATKNDFILVLAVAPVAKGDGVSKNRQLGLQIVGLAR